MSDDNQYPTWAVGGDAGDCPHPGDALVHVGDGDLSAFFACDDCGAIVVARLEDLVAG